MGILGTFLKGAITGIVGLGALSWLYTTIVSEQDEHEKDKEED